MSIRKKLVTGFASSILLTALATGSGWWFANRASIDTKALVNTDLTLLKKMNRAETSVQKARFEEKQFLLTKDPEAYKSAREYIRSASGDFQEIIDSALGTT